MPLTPIPPLCAWWSCPAESLSLGHSHSHDAQQKGEAREGMGCSLKADSSPQAGGAASAAALGSSSFPGWSDHSPGQAWEEGGGRREDSTVFLFPSSLFWRQTWRQGWSCTSQPLCVHLLQQCGQAPSSALKGCFWQAPGSCVMRRRLGGAQVRSWHHSLLLLLISGVSVFRVHLLPRADLRASGANIHASLRPGLGLLCLECTPRCCSALVPVEWPKPGLPLVAELRDHAENRVGRSPGGWRLIRTSCRHLTALTLSS